jgi:hypothetical protein
MDSAIGTIAKPSGQRGSFMVSIAKSITNATVSASTTVADRALKMPNATRSIQQGRDDARLVAPVDTAFLVHDDSSPPP